MGVYLYRGTPNQWVLLYFPSSSGFFGRSPYFDRSKTLSNEENIGDHWGVFDGMSWEIRGLGPLRDTYSWCDGRKARNRWIAEPGHPDTKLAWWCWGNKFKHWLIPGPPSRGG